MNTNGTFEQSNSRPEIVLTFEAQHYLRESGSWAYFLGILGFICTALILLAALFVGTIFSMIAKFQPATAPVLPEGTAGILSLVYILIALFYFFFSFYLFQFGNNIKKGVTFGNQEQVTKALSKLKSFFKLWGITTIVIISLYALIIVGVIVVGIGAATMMHK